MVIFITEMFVGMVLVIYLNTINDPFHQRPGFMLFVISLILIGILYVFCLLQVIHSRFDSVWFGNESGAVLKMLQVFWKNDLIKNN